MPLPAADTVADFLGPNDCGKLRGAAGAADRARQLAVLQLVPSKSGCLTLGLFARVLSDPNPQPDQGP